MSKHMCSKAFRKSARVSLSWLTLSIIAMCATGCTDCKWRWDYQQAEQQARQQGKYVFIFYKWWLSNESNRMHYYIQTDLAVAAQLQDTVNLLLEKDSSPEYANYLAKYGVTSPPAFVVVAPDGTYYVQSGFIPKDRLIEFIKNAKSGRAPGGKRATAGPTHKAP
jgi:thiol:disulfide interchange protein